MREKERNKWSTRGIGERHTEREREREKERRRRDCIEEIE